MTTLTHLTGLDVTEVTRSLIPLIGGEPTDHGLRLVAVSDVADGQAIEVTLQDTTGARRHLHLYAVDVTDTVPHHYTDLGEWCPHSGQGTLRRPSLLRGRGCCIRSGRPL